ncbi:MAG: esterase-like activity of phytase family protein [Rhodospirillales bacterium]
MPSLLLLVLLLVPAMASAAPPSLTVRPVPLSQADPDLNQVGALGFLGGLELLSDDPRFGGWSAGSASSDLTELLLLGDQGAVLDLTLLRDPESGRLIGAEAGDLTALQDRSGQPLTGDLAVDAESLAALGEGAYAVGFERDHRIWRYDQGLRGPAGDSIGPLALETLPLAAFNAGVEALAMDPEGETLVAFLEGPVAPGLTRAFVGRRRAGEFVWDERSYALADDFGVTDAAFLEDGDLLVLERFFSPETGPKARLQRIAGGALAQSGLLQGKLLAELALPLSVDNFEILLVGRGAQGDVQLLLASDDNFNPRQRSLLLLFELKAQP